ncbi:MAG: hypothetical protein HKN49_04090 [Gammaproteobacteria bacterium]|nr:hypothetical protein [Gammaproteobacteria bacterium]
MFCTKAVFGLTAILYSVVISDAYAEQLEIPASLGLEQQGAKLLILGTFHFKDAGLDGYKPQHEVDIFAPERQQELNDILDRLEAYAPTRIAVEMNRSRQDVLDERYSRYLDGEFKLSSNEIYQLGFRLGKRLGHKQLYAVDAQARHYEPRVDPAEFAQQNSQQWLLDDS